MDLKRINEILLYTDAEETLKNISENDKLAQFLCVRQEAFRNKLKIQPPTNAERTETELWYKREKQIVNRIPKYTILQKWYEQKKEKLQGDELERFELNWKRGLYD